MMVVLTMLRLVQITYSFNCSLLQLYPKVWPHVQIFFVGSDRNHEMNHKHRIIGQNTELSELCKHTEIAFSWLKNY